MCPTLWTTLTAGEVVARVDILTDVQKVVFTDFTVHRVTETGVEGEARGLVVEDNSVLDGAPVKAVTYHRLRLEQTSEGWEAEFYVDV